MGNSSKNILSSTVFINLLFYICYTSGLPLLSNSGSHQDDTKLLKDIIEKTVNRTELKNYDLPTNFTSLMVDGFTQVLQDSGVELRQKGKICTPQSKSKLENDFFLANRNKLDCIGLTKMAIPTAYIDEDVFVVTTDSKYCHYNIEQDRDCFPSNREAYCSTKTNITSFFNHGADYFPKFSIGLECQGCADHDIDCLEQQESTCGYRKHSVHFRLLRRVWDKCDENGVELWEVDGVRRQVNAACSCYKSRNIVSYN